MRVLTSAVMSLALSTVFVTAGFAQVAVRHTTAPPGSPLAAGMAPKFTFILFWKQQDSPTQQYAEALRSAVAQRAERAHWTSVNVKDPANQAMVDLYGVSRAPMPLAICVADNGAVTGVFTRRPTEDAVERALVTPAMAEVTKALQEKMIVVVHVQPPAASALPAGAAAFAAAPDFQARTKIVHVQIGDPEESRFLADMQLKPQDVRDSMLVVMAPPGVLVGKFNSSVTRDQIAAELHSAGKCCDNPNCKHNQKAQ